MIDIDRLQGVFREAGLDLWAERLPRQLAAVLTERPHGDMVRWRAALDQLPPLPAPQVLLDAPAVGVSGVTLDDGQRQRIETALRELHPWRKGPYSLHGIEIDTEWRSDWKWQRLQPHIEPLAGRRVLDVGCGNGYHCWRMAGEGAELVVGIDPTQLFLMQFLALLHFIGDGYPVHLLPLGIEDVPADLNAFDTVFSMGVLYHRRSPIDHLTELKGALRPGGQLVLETLVVEGDEQRVLLPHGRYAKMRNVWFIPSPDALVNWLRRAGFRDVRVVDVTATSIEEQRATDWMHFESLPDYLDPQDHCLTVEGYPAPVRAILVATV